MPAFGNTVCSGRKRTFRILSTLPFFKAMCNRESIEGSVSFDPTLEVDETLILWLEYRRPGSSWAKGFPNRDTLMRMVLRDMILYGSIRGLGMFTSFQTDRVSLPFIVRWLAWHGISISPEDDSASFSLSWWYSQVNRQKERVRKMKLPVKGEIDVFQMVQTLSIARSLHFTLLEAFEYLDDSAIQHLSKAHFEALLGVLAKTRFATEDVFTIGTGSSKAERDVDNEIRRSYSALLSQTGTSKWLNRLYIRHGKVPSEFFKLTVLGDSRDDDITNHAFCDKHCVDLALNAGMGVLY